MSKTFTSRPAVSQSRGRGAAPRQTQTNPGQQNKTRTNQLGVTRTAAGSKVQNLVTSPSKRTERPIAGQTGMEGRNTSPQRQQQELGQRMSYEGCYTKISPDEKRRQEINNQARKEEENYHAFKERNRLGHVSYVGTAGGGQISQTDSRQKLLQSHRTSQYDARLKQQKWREDKKKQEELTYQKRKDTQRQKTVKNEQMSLQQQRDQQQKWDEDRKRKNEEFFRRFDRKVTTKQETTGNHNDTVGATGFTDSRTNVTNVPLEHQQTSHTISPDKNSSVFDRNVNILQDMFPHCYDREILQDILRQTDNSLDDAIQLLQE